MLKNTLGLQTNGGIKVQYQYKSNINLSNKKDLLAIQTGGQQPVVIDETTWNEKSGLDPKGASRNLNPNFLKASLNNDDTNFCAATAPILGSTDKGTPGAANSTCQ